MNCPKCGAQIPFWNLKPNCRNCGINIMYYTQETDLIRDAKRSELEFASGRIILAKLKAAFISGALPIARIVLIFMCAGVLVLPFAHVSMTIPFFTEDVTVSGLGIYSLISDGFYNNILNLFGNTLFSDAALGIAVLFGIFAAGVIVALVLLGFYVLNFISIKKAARSQAIISFISAALFLAVPVVALIMKENTGLTEISMSFGGFVACAVYAVNGVVNLLIYRKDIPVRYKENDLERKEILKKVKAGEINLDDLSLPIFESEAEKEERLRALEEALKKEEEGKE